MGKLLKNPDVSPGVLGVRLPVAASSSSDAPVDGVIRFNSTNSKVELYYSNQWNQIAKVGTVNIVKDTFTTANATTYYGPMTYSYTSGNEANVVVFVGGVYQQPVTNYTFVGNSYISLSPTNGEYGQTITVIHNLNSTNAV